MKVIVAVAILALILPVAMPASRAHACVCALPDPDHYSQVFEGTITRAYTSGKKIAEVEVTKVYKGARHPIRHGDWRSSRDLDPEAPMTSCDLTSRYIGKGRTYIFFSDSEDPEFGIGFCTFAQYGMGMGAEEAAEQLGDNWLPPSDANAAETSPTPAPTASAPLAGTGVVAEEGGSPWWALLLIAAGALAIAGTAAAYVRDRTRR